MKRPLALTLAAILLASVFTSCASHEKKTALDPNITVTSSDADSAAAWLDARLETIPDKVVLGTNAGGYGVDLSALENDGYFIRNIDGEVALLAKTSTGLDRAVRKYAKTVESGAPLEDVSYHEGYRVKKLTIAGNDISEYAIVYADESSESVAAAGSELSTYIAKSCGVSVPRFNESEYDAASEKPERKIVLTEDIENVRGLGDEGFQIIVGEDGTLTINGGKWRGAIYGVWDLIEQDLGWRFLGGKFIPNDRTEFLLEADHIDLTSEINRTETPDIPIIRAGGSGPLRLKNTYLTRSSPAAYGSYGWAQATCHGLQSNHKKIFSGEYEGLYNGLDADGRQPCFTNEEILEAIDHFAVTYVQEKLNAGQKIGKEITCVDLGHWDGMWYSFCDCLDCQKVYAKEGALSGAVVLMGNRVATLLEDTFNNPDICASVFAYCGTDKPCKTDPVHNLYISFCYHVSSDWVSCQNHCLSGEECSTGAGITNYLAAKELEAWAKKMDPAMLQIWMYPSNTENYCFNAPLYRNALKDCQYLASLGVSQLFIDSQWIDNGLINEELTMYLYLHFAWECDVTSEEELAMISEWFELVYGEDAGYLLYELSLLAEQAGDRVGCWSALGHSVDYVDYDYISARAEEIWEMCDRAISLAEDAAGEALIEKYVTGIRYMTLVSRYDDMYTNGTNDEREFITAKYAEWWDTVKKYNFCTFGGIERSYWKYLPDTFDPDVHPHTWIESETYAEPEE